MDFQAVRRLSVAEALAMLEELAGRNWRRGQLSPVTGPVRLL
jgi:hypothetical protein